MVLWPPKSLRLLGGVAEGHRAVVKLYSPLGRVVDGPLALREHTEQPTLALNNHIPHVCRSRGDKRNAPVRLNAAPYPFRARPCLASAAPRLQQPCAPVSRRGELIGAGMEGPARAECFGEFVSLY